MNKNHQLSPRLETQSGLLEGEEPATRRSGPRPHQTLLLGPLQQTRHPSWIPASHLQGDIRKQWEDGPWPPSAPIGDTAGENSRIWLQLPPALTPQVQWIIYLPQPQQVTLIPSSCCPNALSRHPLSSSALLNHTLPLLPRAVRSSLCLSSGLGITHTSGGKLRGPLTSEAKLLRNQPHSPCPAPFWLPLSHIQHGTAHVRKPQYHTVGPEPEALTPLLSSPVSPTDCLLVTSYGTWQGFFYGPQS